MGGPMASRLVDAGYGMTICDVDDAAAEALVAKGATRVDTAKEVADREETVLVSLPTPDIVGRGDTHLGLASEYLEKTHGLSKEEADRLARRSLSSGLANNRD